MNKKELADQLRTPEFASYRAVAHVPANRMPEFLGKLVERFKSLSDDEVIRFFAPLCARCVNREEEPKRHVAMTDEQLDQAIENARNADEFLHLSRRILETQFSLFMFPYSASR
jgi:hypothetical protein